MKHFVLPSLVIFPIISLAFLRNGNDDTQLKNLTESINKSSVSLNNLTGVNNSTSFTSSKEEIDVSFYTSKLNTITRTSVKNTKTFTEKTTNTEVANSKTISPSFAYYSLHNLIEKYS